MGGATSTAIPAILLALCMSLGRPSSVCAAETPAQGSRSQPPETPHQIINALMQRIYAIGETTVSFADAVDAEKIAADKIQAYRAGPSANGLIEVNSGGRTPLMVAAYDGFPQVMTALLASDLVRRQINAHDNGLHRQ